MNEVADPIRAPTRANAALLARALLADLPFHVLAALIFASCAVVFAVFGQALDMGAIAVNAQLYAAGGITLILFDVCATLARERPRQPTRYLFDHYRDRVCDPGFITALLALAVLIAFMPFFSALKSMIPRLNAFTWDATFIAWDRTLFLGQDAWRVIQPLFGYPLVTAALAYLYHAWILLIYLGTLCLLFWRAAVPVRRQYMVGFLLVWSVIGGCMAIAFASVGPCFVGPILGDQTFADQMEYLEAANREVPILTLPVQQMLLDWHLSDTPGLGSGITAMPSMHVAMATLFWLAMRRVHRLAGRFFLGFLLVIWIGSVHLAYHYAVDGLVSVFAALVLWHLANQAIAWWDGQAFLRTNTVPAE